MAGPPPPELPLKPGTELPDGTTVQQYLGRSAGGLSYFGEHPEHGRVVIKFLAHNLQDTATAMRDALTSLVGVQHKNVQPFLHVGEHQGKTYLVYGFVEGMNLRIALEERVAQGDPFTFRAVYNVLGHLAVGLEQLHGVAPHGVLTNGNVFVSGGGRVVVSNAGFARVMLAALGPESDAFRDSAFIAPEVRADPWEASEASDFYSLEVIAVSLLSGEDPTVATLPLLLEDVREQYGTKLGAFLDACLAEEPGMRISTTGEFNSELAGVLDSVKGSGEQKARTFTTGAMPALPPMEPGAPAQKPPAPKAPSDDLFAGIELPSAPIGGSVLGGNDDERWLVNRDGRDYGPYTEQQIKDQLERDEIDENTQILDTFTQEMDTLIDVEVFTDFVMDYIPRREKRRQEEQERREEVVRQVKRKGSTTFLTAAVGVAVLLGSFAMFIRAKPAEYPLNQVVRPFRYEFAVPQPDYQGIAADQQLIASLFNFDEPTAASSSSGSSRGSSGSSRSGDSDDDLPSVDDDYVVNFDSSRPASKLTDEQVTSTLYSNLGRVQGCFENELRENPSFTGVTVNWSIRPDGRTFNVRVEGRGRITSSLESCLTRAFRRIRFPEFNDVPMNVSFPFNLQ